MNLIQLAHEIFMSSSDPNAHDKSFESLTFRLITDFPELQALAPSWQRLLDQSASAEPMCSPTWLLTWWSIYGEGTGRSLRVGLFLDGDQLIGLAPLCERRHRHRPGISMSRLEFLGADVDEGDGVCSEYLNIIVRKGDEDRVAPVFVAEITRGSFGAWDELVLDAMNGQGTMPDALLAAFRRAGFRADKKTTVEAPYLGLPQGWDDYLNSLNAHNRRYLWRSLLEFETWAAGDSQLEFATTPESLAKGEEILRTLHNHRWTEGDGIPGAFSRPRFTAFHHSIMRQLLDQGQLELFWLTVRGQPIAASYQILANNKVYFYQSGRRLDVPPSIRPGIVITMRAIRRALDQGLREYDFLGGAVQYKLTFTKTTRPLVQVRIARSGIREWLRRGAEAAIGWARRLRGVYRRLREKRPQRERRQKTHPGERRGVSPT